MRGKGSLIALLTVVAIGLLAWMAMAVSRNSSGLPATGIKTPYQAVVLNNGQVYFGKLDELGTPYPILTDVHYVQGQVNQDTKQVTNTLVKRGKELHGPEIMVLSASQILFIESISPDSTIGKLIDEAKKK